MRGMTNRSNRCRRPIATVLLAATATAQANQLADLPLEELMRIEVVSAARKSQRLADVPASMHVISADDIRSSGARNLPEALRLVPGMDVAQLSASRWAVSTRGFNGRYANKLLVLVDGRSVYSPMFSGVLWEAERVPLDTIERIEVLHGPAGSVWGSNAVNGVINIITKAAGETQGSFADVSAGDGGQRSLRLRHGGRTDEHSAWRLGAQADRGDSGRGADGSDANDAYRQAMADWRWDRAWSVDSRSTVEAQVMRSRSNEIQLEGSYLPPYQTLLPTRLDVDRVTIAARHEERFSDTASASLALSLVDERIRFGDRVHARPRTLDASVSAVRRLGDAHELIFGGGLRHVDLPASRTAWITFSPENRRGVEWSAFIQDEWAIVPGRWRLNAGVRLDHDLYSGTHPQPNLRLLFTPADDVALWAGLSRANRSPARGQQDGIIRIFVLPPGSPGNPGPLPIQLLSGNGQSGHVDAERNLDAVEFGLRAQASATLSFDAAAFWHRLRDDIGAGVPAGAPVFVPTPQPHLEVGNLSQPYTVRLHGVEASADWRPAVGWRHVAGLAYLGVRGPANASTTGLDRQLYASPRWQAQWRSVVDLAPAWRLDARLRYVGQRGAPGDATQRVDDYTALDATLSWRAGAATEIAIGGTNLLRPAVVEFAPDFGLASATLVPRRAFVRWRQSF